MRKAKKNIVKIPDPKNPGLNNPELPVFRKMQDRSIAKYHQAKRGKYSERTILNAQILALRNRMHKISFENNWHHVDSQSSLFLMDALFIHLKRIQQFEILISIHLRQQHL